MISYTFPVNGKAISACVTENNIQLCFHSTFRAENGENSDDMKA